MSTLKPVKNLCASIFRTQMQRDICVNIKFESFTNKHTKKLTCKHNVVNNGIKKVVIICLQICTWKIYRLTKTKKKKFEKRKKRFKKELHSLDEKPKRTKNNVLKEENVGSMVLGVCGRRENGNCENDGRKVTAKIMSHWKLNVLCFWRRHKIMKKPFASSSSYGESFSALWIINEWVEKTR